MGQGWGGAGDLDGQDQTQDDASAGHSPSAKPESERDVR